MFLENNNVENGAEDKMAFVIGDTKYCQIQPADCHFYMTEDSSLLYNGLRGDYSVLLGGNWRFELLVDHSTGLCTQIQSFLHKLEVTCVPLELPKAERKDLYFTRRAALEPGCGCHYFPFQRNAFWDKENRILCFGDPHSNGKAVEFTPKIIAVIDHKQLMCVYLILDDLQVHLD